MMLRSVIFQNFGGLLLIFGHFINVQKIFRTINNAGRCNNFNTYWFYYLKKGGAPPPLNPLLYKNEWFTDLPV